MLSENGPFRPAEGGTKLDVFEYSWTKAANLVFIEQPLFVGYSISSSNTDSKTDDEVSEDNMPLPQSNLFK